MNDFEEPVVDGHVISYVSLYSNDKWHSFGPLPSQNPPCLYSSSLNQTRCTTEQILQIIHAEGPIREPERE